MRVNFLKNIWNLANKTSSLLSRQILEADKVTELIKEKMERTTWRYSSKVYQ